MRDLGGPALVAIMMISCGDGTPPGARERPPVTAGSAVTERAATSEPASPPPPPVQLAARPRIDLLANRVRWHLRDDLGLVIHVGTEALRKYVLDYRDPWGPARIVDGEATRALKGKASLTFPWDGDGAARVAIVHQGKPPRVRLDGRALSIADDALAMPAPWAVTAFEVPALAAGEHVLTVEPGRKGQPIATVAIGAPAGAASCTAPRLRSAAGVDGALGGWRRMSLYQELPAQAYLSVTPVVAGAPVHARVRLIPQHGDPAVIFDDEVGPGAAAKVLPLGHAGELVRLELEVVGAGCERLAWRDAAIAVAVAEVKPRPAPIDNVVLVVVDTLRSDHLAAYTAKTPVQTPWLTAATAERGTVFARNQSMAPSSPPSHATIQTGQIPRVHGVAGDDGKLVAGAPVLSAILGAADIFTGYIGDNDFAMGRLKTAAKWRRAFAPIFDGGGKDCGPIVTRALAVAREAVDGHHRFFLSTLPLEPHVPYRYHPGISERYLGGPPNKPFTKQVGGPNLDAIAGHRLKMTPAMWDQLRGLYDGEIEHLDGCLAAFSDGLEALGIADRTAIVVTSDHGEGMGERTGKVGHAYSLNRELVDVPLIVIGGLGAGRVEVPTSNLDIAATILDLMGLPADPRMQGASLIDLALGPALPRVVASEYGRSYALRAAGWHLVVGYDGDGALHDVVADPEEASDVSAREPMVLRYLRDAAGLYLAHRSAWRAATWGQLNDVAPTSPLAE